MHFMYSIVQNISLLKLFEVQSYTKCKVLLIIVDFDIIFKS